MRKIALLIGFASAAAVSTAVLSVVPYSQQPHQVPTEVSAKPKWPSSERIELHPAQHLDGTTSGAPRRNVKSLINVQGKLRHGEFRWSDIGVPDGPVWVRVDLDAQIISIFRAGHEVGTAVILFGAEDHLTPTGEFPVKWKRKDHHSSTYNAPMPYTLRLTDDGVAIHGSDVRQGAATHGCIGVPLEFARRLYREVGAGDPVIIVDSSSQSTA